MSISPLELQNVISIVRLSKNDDSEACESIFQIALPLVCNCVN